MYLLEKAEHLLKVVFYNILDLSLKLVTLLCNYLPEKILTGVFTACASIFFRFSRRYRKRIKKNLQLAFGPSSNSHKFDTITHQLAYNCGISALETLFSATNRQEKTLNSIRIQGRENLDRALENGKGVVAVSAHLGNFTLLGPKMVTAGYPFSMLVKELPYVGIARTLRTIQDKQKGHYIYIKPWRPALRQILACLRKNQVVCLLSDERKGQSEVQVDFFGHPAQTATGAAVFSLKTGAPLVPIFIVRHEDGSHTIFIEPQLDVTLSGNQREDILSLTAASTRAIEDYVRKYPGQWFWLNDRWKIKRKHKTRKQL
jgi:KDO2-lipid IV(A) lauroyltransferase